MNTHRIIPDNPLEFIRKCIRSRNILWTYHVNMRLEERSITREMILSSVDTMEIIEEYPQDKYLPSYLILSHYENMWYHILIAIDVPADNVRVLTAYLPNPHKWESKFRTRRKNQ